MKMFFCESQQDVGFIDFFLVVEATRPTGNSTNMNSRDTKSTWLVLCLWLYENFLNISTLYAYDITLYETVK